MQPLKLDVIIKPSGDLRHDLEQIKRAEQLGYDGIWVKETARNPFFPLTLAAKDSCRIRLGTEAALAFARSPMVAAQIAWDLARQSQGRFILGLGAGAGTPIERQFSEDRLDPGGRMREYIESLRAIWDTFQTGARLRYRGLHYQFRLMAPFFNPGPIAHPAIPIFLAGDRPEICQLAGEICQGYHALVFHGPAHLRERIIPAVEAGLTDAGRERSEFVVTASVFVISGRTENERRRAEMTLRQRFARFASAPVNRHLMSQAGWGALPDDLPKLAREKRWNELEDAISVDQLRQFAVIAEPAEVFSKIVECYAGIADRLCLEWNSDNPQLFEAIADSRGLNR